MIVIVKLIQDRQSILNRAVVVPAIAQQVYSVFQQNIFVYRVRKVKYLIPLQKRVLLVQQAKLLQMLIHHVLIVKLENTSLSVLQ